MDCRTKLGPLLRANAALRVLHPGSHRGIHFPPGPFSSDDDEQERAPPSRRWFRAAYARLLRHAVSPNCVDHADDLPRHAAMGPSWLARTRPRGRRTSTRSQPSSSRR